MKLSIYGTGYVGLVTGVCFAELGNDVLCVDINEEKIQLLQTGQVPFYEPGLTELLVKNIQVGRLQFSSDLTTAVDFSEVQFICVGTPPAADGSANLDSVFHVAQLIGERVQSPITVINKSTVPVGTGQQVHAIISGCLSKRGELFNCSVLSNPEFLREGRAVNDFMHPDRVVVGVSEGHSTQVLNLLYSPLCSEERPLLVMDLASAELTKYAANTFLASKISLINEIANIADCIGADIRQVQRGISYDVRIGKEFLSAGCGYGGSCLPKDVKALHHTAAAAGYEAELLHTIDQVNQQQKTRLFDKIAHYFQGNLDNKVLAVWGLAFKPGTDDIREATSLDMLNKLFASGARVQAYDPMAGNAINTYFGARKDLQLYDNALACLSEADALVVLTEWPEFRVADYSDIAKRLRHKVIFDGRNVFDSKQLTPHDIKLIGIGCHRA